MSETERPAVGGGTRRWTEDPAILWVCDNCDDLAECEPGTECEVCCEGTIQRVPFVPVEVVEAEGEGDPADEHMYRVEVEGGGAFLYDLTDVGRFAKEMAQQDDRRRFSVRRVTVDEAAVRSEEREGPMSDRTATGAEAVRASVEGAKAPVATRLYPNELRDLAAEVARRAAPVFAACNWEWGSGDGMRVPDQARIAATVMDLLEDAGQDHVFNGGSVHCGRFEVIREVEEGENIEWCTVNLQIGFATAHEPEAAGNQTEPEAESVDHAPRPVDRDEGEETDGSNV